MRYVNAPEVYTPVLLSNVRTGRRVSTRTPSRGETGAGTDAFNVLPSAAAFPFEWVGPVGDRLPPGLLVHATANAVTPANKPQRTPFLTIPSCS
jgi:hypothetical protein